MDGLIGSSFLKRFVTAIDSARRSVKFADESQFQSPGCARPLNRDAHNLLQRCVAVRQPAQRIVAQVVESLRRDVVEQLI